MAISFHANEGTLERWIRLFAAEAQFLVGFFWVGGVAHIVLLIIAAILAFTALSGFCALYALIGWHPRPGRSISRTATAILAILAVLAIAGGAYASAFFTKKIFLEDYAAMNQYYKQALFFTGQHDRARAISNYDQLTASYAAFREKYRSYRPYALSGDPAFESDLDTIAGLIAVPKDKIQTGDLASAHLDLEKVRPAFQDILKRNGFSMLAIALVDFHDAMEGVIAAADAKDAQAVQSAYADADEKLRAVEATADDTEIQAIRSNLNAVKALAEKGDTQSLPGAAATLKGSFVKVYLKRG